MDEHSYLYLAAPVHLMLSFKEGKGLSCDLIMVPVMNF